jgi:hypothetical protein
MGAAGIKQPDRQTVTALRSALVSYATDAKNAAGGWTFIAFNDPATNRPLVTATMVQEIAVRNGQSNAYELTITCEKNSDISKGGTASNPPEMRLVTYTRAGSPATRTGRDIPVAARSAFAMEIDGKAATAAPYQGKQSAEAATFVVPLPSHTLTIRNLFPNETVSFPFGRLTPTLREVLSTCVTRRGTGL